MAEEVQRIEFFQEREFNLKRFIDDLVIKTPPIHSTQQDDLLPFITTFESALKDLESMSSQVLKRLSIDVGDSADCDHDMKPDIEGKITITTTIATLVNTIDEKVQLARELKDTGLSASVVMQKRDRSAFTANVLDHLYRFMVQKDEKGVKEELFTQIIREHNLDAGLIVKCLLEIAKETASEESNSGLKQMCIDIQDAVLTQYREALRAQDTMRLSLIYNLLKCFQMERTAVELYVGEHALLKQSDVKPQSLVSFYNVNREMPALVRCGREEPEDTVLTDFLSKLSDFDTTDMAVIFKQDFNKVKEELFVHMVKKRLAPMLRECLRQAKQHSLLAYQRQLHAIFIQLTRWCSESRLGLTVVDSIDGALSEHLGQVQTQELDCLDYYLNILCSSLNQSGKDQNQKIIAVVWFPDGQPLVTEQMSDNDKLQRALVLVTDGCGRMLRLTGQCEFVRVLDLLLGKIAVFCQFPQANTESIGYDVNVLKKVQSIHTQLTNLQLWFDKMFSLMCIQDPEQYMACLNMKNAFIQKQEQLIDRSMNASIATCATFVKEHYVKAWRKTQLSIEKTSQPMSQLVSYLQRVSRDVQANLELGLVNVYINDLYTQIVYLIIHEGLLKLSKNVDSMAVIVEVNHLALFLGQSDHHLQSILLSLTKLSSATSKLEFDALLHQLKLGSVNFELVKPFLRM